jgi:hypothetical protein
VWVLTSRQQDVGHNHKQKYLINPLKTRKSFSIGNVSNKSDIPKLRNEEQIEFREYLVTFGPEFLSSRLLCKNRLIKIYTKGKGVP